MNEPARRPRAAPASVAPHLQVVAEPDRPTVRLGVAWAAVTFASAVLAPWSLALWLAPQAALAAGQAVRARRQAGVRPVEAVAVVGAALVPLAAVGGWYVAGIAVVLVVAAGLFLVRASRSVGPGRHLAGTLVVPIGFGAAAAGPVLARGADGGVVLAVVLLTYVAVYDASVYLVGTGAHNIWEGPAAGVASIAAVTLAVAAVFSPPFAGAAPWVLGGLATVTLVLGPIAGGRLARADTGLRMPAVRRLDSLLLAGPLWSAAAVLLANGS